VSHPQLGSSEQRIKSSLDAPLNAVVGARETFMECGAERQTQGITDAEKIDMF
jgi:hypothetical protein